MTTRPSCYDSFGVSGTTVPEKSDILHDPSPLYAVPIVIFERAAGGPHHGLRRDPEHGERDTVAGAVRLGGPLPSLPRDCEPPGTVLFGPTEYLLSCTIPMGHIPWGRITFLGCPNLARRWARSGTRQRRGGARGRPHRRFARQLIHFIPESRRDSVHPWLRRQCDGTLGGTGTGRGKESWRSRRRCRPRPRRSPPARAPHRLGPNRDSAQFSF
jgi:hypothetical protein